MSTGCKSSHNGFLDVSRSNCGLRISGWIGQLYMALSLCPLSHRYWWPSVNSVIHIADYNAQHVYYFPPTVSRVGASLTIRFVRVWHDRPWRRAATVAVSIPVNIGELSRGYDPSLTCPFPSPSPALIPFPVLSSPTFPHSFPLLSTLALIVSLYSS